MVAPYLDEVSQSAMTVNLPINVDNLLRRRTIEGERVEYKAGWNPAGVLHALTAFANDFHNLGGGYVVLGVEERGGQPVLPPRGIDPSTVDSIQKELLNLGNSAIRPPYHPVTAVHEIDGRTILTYMPPAARRDRTGRESACLHDGRIGRTTSASTAAPCGPPAKMNANC